MLGLLRENALTAIILAALTAALTAYLRGVFDAILGDVLPKGAEISCIGWEWIADRWPFRKREPIRDVFRILIAKLDRDDAGGTLTQAVVRAFQGQNAIEGVQTCRILRIRGAGPAAEDAAAKIGRMWLTRRNADVLVFGEVLPPKGETLNLHFLSSDRSQGFAPKSFGFEAGSRRAVSGNRPCRCEPSDRSAGEIPCRNAAPRRSPAGANCPLTAARNVHLGNGRCPVCIRASDVDDRRASGRKPGT